MGLSRLDIEKHMIEHEIIKTASKKYVDDNDFWTRVGTVLSPKNINDDITMGTGDYTGRSIVLTGDLEVDDAQINGTLTVDGKTTIYNEFEINPDPLNAIKVEYIDYNLGGVFHAVMAKPLSSYNQKVMLQEGGLFLTQEFASSSLFQLLNRGNSKNWIFSYNDATNKFSLNTTSNDNTWRIEDINLEGTKFKITETGAYAIRLTNKTGANSVAGKLVIASTGTNDACMYGGSLEDETIGVFLDDGVADGEEAWIVVSGIAEVMFDNNVATTRGYWVSGGTTAGYANITASPTPARHFEEIGHCIQSVTAGGVGTFIKARCVLHFN